MDNYGLLLKEIYNAGSNFVSNYNKIAPLGINNVNRLLLCGMGGSGIGAEYIKSINCNDNIDILVCKNYIIKPRENDLAIITSYSGNTEETIQMAETLRNSGVKMIFISSGGYLEKMAMSNGITYIKIKDGLQPRAALPHLLGSLYRLVENLLDLPKITKDIANRIISQSTKMQQRLNEFIKIADVCIKSSPIILSDIMYQSIALRMRCQLNENAKLIASSFVVPEYNHNGIIGFDGKQGKSQSIFLLYPNNVHPRTALHFKYYEDRMPDLVHTLLRIETSEETILEQFLDLTWKVDVVSVLAARLQEVDPISVPSIDDLKNYLKTINS